MISTNRVYSARMEARQQPEAADAAQTTSTKVHNKSGAGLLQFSIYDSGTVFVSRRMSSTEEESWRLDRKGGQ